MRILAIETSCDETAAAIVVRDNGDKLAHIERSIVASQIDLHIKYGGVYPEVASREHIRQILPVICEALDLPIDNKDRLPDLNLRLIDYLAVTHGPGLIGSLLIGTQSIAAIGMATEKPILPVNHLAGHIYASFLQTTENQTPPEFPLLALVVSGGHSMLIRMESHDQYKLLGQTRDDAAGEAFDKIAKLLHLPYPGGPQISKLGARGDRFAYNFPIADLGKYGSFGPGKTRLRTNMPFEERGNEGIFDFSFSGLKTAVLRVVQGLPQPLRIKQKADIAASFERAVVDALLEKTVKALDDYPVHHMILGGGVAANSHLRERLAATLAHRTVPVALHVPPINLCTDNAAVIGCAAAFGDLKPVSPTELQTFARLPLV